MKNSSRFLLIASLALVLNSCATSGRDDQYSASNDIDDSSSAPTQAPEIKPSGKPAAGAESNLDAAIKRQSDSDVLKAAQEILLANPNHVKALNAISLTYYKKGKFKAAEFFNRKALKESETSGLYNNLGLIKLAQKEEREAIASFKKAYSINPNDAVAAANLGSIYVKNKDYKNAELALETAYKKNSKDLKIANNYAISLAANQKNEEATKVYEKALSENASARDIMLNYSIHLIDNVNLPKQGLDILNRLKFVGVPSEARNLIKELENRAKAGLK